eukprot:gene7897-8093_t
MLWAAVSLGVFPSVEWMRAWAVASESSKERWSSADFGTAIWALGRLAGSSAGRVLLPDLPWRLAMMKASKRVLPAAEPLHFKAREWAVLLAVLAKQGITPEPFWQRSCHLVLQQRLRFMTARDFAMSLWGICQLGVPPRDLWRDRFFTDSYSQLFFLTASCCCRLVWSLGKLRWLPPQEWSDRLFLETYAKLSSFKAPELAGTLHGLAQLELRPPVQWMWQATAVMAVAALEMTPQEVTTCLWALSKMQYQPPRQWLDALAARAAALLPAAWQPQAPHQSAASSSRRPHPRKLTIMGGDAAAGTAALLPHVPVRRRYLGAGDLRVVLTACFRLQHHLPRSHPLMAAAQQLIDEHPKLQEIKEMIISMESSVSKGSATQTAHAPDSSSSSSAIAVNSAAGSSSSGDVFNAGEKPRPGFSRGRRRGRLGRPNPGGIMIDSDAAGFAMLGG